MTDTEIETSTPHRRVGYGPIAAVLVTLGVYFASQVIVGLLIYLSPYATGWSDERLNNWLDTSVFAQFITVLLIEAATLWLTWQFLKAREVSLKVIGLIRPKLRDVGMALAGYGVYFALFIVITVAVEALVPGLNMDQEQELVFSKETTGAALWLVFLSLVILPAATEEIVTRGFLYTGLRSKLSFVWAAVITSVIFAAAHLQWGTGNALLWVAALDTFVLSLILVYLREKTGSLWPPILVHAFKNTLAFALLFIFKAS